MNLFSHIYNLTRPLLGTTMCIHPISCGNYAKWAIKHKAIYKAVPLIIFRVLSCNPLTSLVKKHISLK